MFRSLSPAGAPIGFKSILHGIKAELCRDDSISTFREQVRTYFGCNHVFLLSSGKAALCLVLKALRTISGKNEVVIPAYSSFCLASAVAAAGVAVKICDIDPDYLDFDLEHLEKLVDDKTLAVIPVHLFGLVARLNEIAKIAYSQGAYVIEDAAQATGAQYEGRFVGTIGNVGIYSLGRGKSVSTIHGGIIVTEDDKIASIISEQISRLPAVVVIRRLEMLFYALGLSFFLNPSLFFIPNHIPFLRLGANIYDPGFTSYAFSRFQAGMGISVFDRIDTYNNQRRFCAQTISAKIKKLEYIRLPSVAAKSDPSYTRFPVIFEDQEVRDNIYKKLSNAKLGVSKNFPYPLCDLKEFVARLLNEQDNFDVARKLSQTLLTIPTHPFVKIEDIDNIIRIFEHEKPCRR